MRIVKFQLVDGEPTTKAVFDLELCEGVILHDLRLRFDKRGFWIVNESRIKTHHLTYKVDRAILDQLLPVARALFEIAGKRVAPPVTVAPIATPSSNVIKDGIRKLFAGC
jgi:DNA-binding cell septation regulator SpoVG